MLMILTLNTLTGVCVFVVTVLTEIMLLMEDEEHVIFICPEYNTCRLNYPELFNHSENNIKYV